MSNWVAYKEKEIGLPVFKRAKHGIHFKRSDGQIQAEFVGKPCHYLDGGLWKPIDTKLVSVGDGSYGCPHSPVRVKPDGTVTVAGSDYVQRVGLPSAQTGLVDGDKIVRKFAFGEQRMWVTENGFKSEIMITRIPTLAEARKLIASERGTLSKEYLKSLTTATDANNDVHTVSTLSAFRTWLASAVFPVVIDPDFSVTSGVGADARIYSSGATNNYGVAIYIIGGCNLIRFDLSSIASSSICTDASLALVYAENDANTRAINLYKITDANGDWIEGTKNGTLAGAGEPCWNAKAADGAGGVTTAWAGSAGLSSAGTDYIDTVIATLSSTLTAFSKIDVPFNASGLSVLQDWFGDANNNGLKLSEAHNKYCCSGEYTTAGYRPVLTVTYTAAATGHVAVSRSANVKFMHGYKGVR